MIYLIVGRSGAGKDRLAEELVKRGLKVVNSYTTRPKRYESENTHIFVSEEEANAITDKVATTIINGYEYFATKSQVEESDVYIIDPNGVKELTKNMPETSFHIVHVTADNNTRREFAIKRSDDPEKESETFDARNIDENKQFSEFEKLIQETLNKKQPIAENVCAIHSFQNDYLEHTVENYAGILVAQKQEFDNLKAIMKQCVSFGVLTSDEPDHINVAYETDDGETDWRSVPIELAVDSLLADENGFNTIMHCWLSNDFNIKQEFSVNNRQMDRCVLIKSDGYSIDTTFYSNLEQAQKDMRENYELSTPDIFFEDFKGMSDIGDTDAILYDNGRNVYVWNIQKIPSLQS